MFILPSCLTSILILHLITPPSSYFCLAFRINPSIYHSLSKRQLDETGSKSHHDSTVTTTDSLEIGQSSPPSSSLLIDPLHPITKNQTDKPDYQPVAIVPILVTSALLTAPQRMPPTNLSSSRIDAHALWNASHSQNSSRIQFPRLSGNQTIAIPTKTAQVSISTSTGTVSVPPTYPSANTTTSIVQVIPSSATNTPSFGSSAASSSAPSSSASTSLYKCEFIPSSLQISIGLLLYFFYFNF